jgi:hypothetical protein
MLTGYNTDVLYGGVTYHVQTEDKGITNPVILSLVYQGGTILAAKRTNYGDLIQEGRVDEGELAKALERQHRILVAAIQSGKSERLIQLSRQQSEQGQGCEPSPAAHGLEDDASGAATAAAAYAVAAQPQPASLEVEAAALRHAPLGPRVAPSLEQMISNYVPPVAPQERLRLELLTSPDFYAGERRWCAWPSRSAGCGRRRTRRSRCRSSARASARRASRRALTGAGWPTFRSTSRPSRPARRR